MATREETLGLILDTIKPDDLVIACNGKLGRELFELRKEKGQPNDDFILIGAMGCALAVALGVAMNTQRKVYCLLGDGNFLMKMGSLATYRHYSPKNLFVYILNNNSHDSTGGQATCFDSIRGLIPHSYNFRVLDLSPGYRVNLGRPTITAADMTRNFMKKCLPTI